MQPELNKPRPGRAGDADRSPRGAFRSWLSIREKGSRLGILFVALVSNLLGRNVGRLVLHVPVLYFVLFHRGMRRASRDYLGRVFGRPVDISMVYRHVLCFARVTLDRVFLLKRRDELFKAVYSGHELMTRLHAEGRGAILLSAHLGSSAAMCLENRSRRLRIHIAGYFRNARMINSLLEKLDPETTARVIHLDPSRVDSVLAIRERIQAGEIVAMTADRSGINDRCVEIPFLGGIASFPVGPFMLAALLRCPVFLVFALYREPNVYELYCEPFETEKVTLPRHERQATLERYAQRYAQRVEHYCRLAPYNWFNFFEFWTANQAPATLGKGKNE